MRIALLGIVVLGCGGRLPGAGDGGDSGDSGADAGAGWTTCSSPSGQRVCYGPDACPFDIKVCLGCINGLKIPSNDSTTLGVCVGSPGLAGGFCSEALDGQLCVQFAPNARNTWTTGEFDLGLLFLRNGAAERVRYADFGLFDGTPLPEPTTCPSLGAARICGGNCGGCASDQFCHGRSPLHPFGFCVPKTPSWCTATNPTACPSGSGCFIFKVQPAAQPLADNEGLCMPKAACLELATSYPGGGTCSGI